MCTVSFVNHNDTIIITSNRDEHVDRAAALDPETYSMNGRKVTFPKDPKGKGTWFATNDLGTIIVLLNGAEERHVMKPSYRKSRGLIVLDIISEVDSLNAWNAIDLNAIEPFTIILYVENALYQLRWNGVAKTNVTFDVNKSHVWSSSTLYTNDVITLRQEWFKEFMDGKSSFSPDDLMDFHSKTHLEDSENGVIIKRDNGVMTKSITQVVSNENRMKMTHFNLLENNRVSRNLQTH